MGGTNSETINGLRLHIKDGDVHIHDDSKKTKFFLDKETFKGEIDDALNRLYSQEGVVKIDGKGSTCFCVLKEGRNIQAFLLDGTSVKGKLKSFLRGC